MSLIKEMAMEIDYEQRAEIYLDFISMIHDRQIEGSNIFNRCKKWNTLHPGNYAILINIKDNKAEIELYQCYTGFDPSIFNDNNTIEIPIMDLCVENAFIKRMVDWRDSLIATEVEKAKKEKSYDYQKFLDLKKLFGE